MPKHTFTQVGADGADWPSKTDSRRPVVPVGVIGATSATGTPISVILACARLRIAATTATCAKPPASSTRCGNPLGRNPAETTFVFVTPWRWSGKVDWVVEHRKEGFWRAGSSHRGRPRVNHSETVAGSAHLGVRRVLNLGRYPC